MLVKKGNGKREKKQKFEKGGVVVMTTKDTPTVWGSREGYRDEKKSERRYGAMIYESFRRYFNEEGNTEV